MRTQATGRQPTPSRPMRNFPDLVIPDHGAARSVFSSQSVCQKANVTGVPPSSRSGGSDESAVDGKVGYS
ncbi:hypothetical protein ACWY4P_35940 [Streptomyces sp. LZ34]